MTIFKAGDIVMCVNSGSGVFEGLIYTVEKGNYESGASDMVRLEGRDGRNYSNRFILATGSVILGDNDDDCI